jgi:hypothetical protein
VGHHEFSDLNELRKLKVLFKGEMFDMEIISGRKDGGYFGLKRWGNRF